MIKKISTQDLTPGMFIHDFNCGWMEHPFFTRQLKVKSRDEIQKIRKHGIKELYIDTDKGVDVRKSADAMTPGEVSAELDQRIVSILEEDEGDREPVRATMMEEVARAGAVKKEARRIAQNIMEDVRLGKQVEVAQVDNVVGDMVDSIFRNEDALMSLGLIKQSDEYTFMHSVNVCVFLVSFAKSLGLEYEVIRKMGVGALLHDIGKMKVPQEVLNKPGRLTDDEFKVMKSHAAHSQHILEHTEGIDPISSMVAGRHHERFDGSGYPGGLQGEDIGLYGQMAAIVDVYDAITSDRVYHKGMTVPEALRKILEWSKFHFNPDLAQRFIRCVGIYPIGTLVRLENDGLAVVIESNQASLLHPLVRVIFDAKRKRFLQPKDINLFDHRDGEGGWTIKGHEQAQKWKIDTTRFLPQLEIIKQQ